MGNPHCYLRNSSNTFLPYAVWMQNMFVTCTHVRIIIFLYLTYLSGCYIKDGQEKHWPILFKELELELCQ